MGSFETHRMGRCFWVEAAWASPTRSSHEALPFRANSGAGKNSETVKWGIPRAPRTSPEGIWTI